MSRQIKIIALIFVPIFLISTLLTSCTTDNHQKKIGIIVPIQHKAMDEIVAGFTETLQAKNNNPIKFKVANAQGDITLQRAIIQQMKNEDYTLVAPIGLSTTQMTIAAIKKQPIVSLASSLSDQDRKNQKTCNIAVVHDEIPVDKIIEFIHTVYPSASRFVLVHSASEKIFPDIKKGVATGKQLGMQIKPLMVPTLNELYSIANAIPTDTQGIIVLKDSLIVSGIDTLAIAAKKRGIPLITSDQGSAEDGAGFAIGVPEREIGVKGAEVAMKILAGEAPCKIPPVTIKDLTVFINQRALDAQKQSVEPINAAAKKMNYQINIVNKK